MKKYFSILFIGLLFLYSDRVFSQEKVGLVLSGGGASAIAHIGVLEALEENHIPIDYITGTSMGALIGALYASGYSPKQIEALFTSERFQRWSNGEINPKFKYYLRKNEPNASLVTFKLRSDSLWQRNLPSSMISSTPIDLGLMKYLSAASAESKYNFDSLFVPFRCIASGAVSKEKIVFKKGSLVQAVRASITYPFYIKPISINKDLMYDGGLYDNFPADVMQKSFSPSIIIGSNVAYNFPPPRKDNILSQIRALLVHKTNYKLPKNTKGIIIQPDTKNVSTFDFSQNKDLIDSGYKAAMADMPAIKAMIKRRVDEDSLRAVRKKFNHMLPPLVYDSIKVIGLKKHAKKYVVKSLHFKKKDSVSIKELMPNLLKLSTDNKLKDFYPLSVFNPKTEKYALHLKVRPRNKIHVSFGGDISSRPINEGFVGLRYSYLSSFATTLSANVYFGKFYTSGQGQIRFDFAGNVPFYVKLKGVANKWDYFRSSTAFFLDQKPSFLVINDAYLEGEIATSAGYSGKIGLGGDYGYLNEHYYQSTDFTQSDTADLTSFHYLSSYVFYDRNTLNRKQYASKGSRLHFEIRGVDGKETTIPGSTSTDTSVANVPRKWFQFHASYEKYFNQKGVYRLGVYFDANYANQPFFHNYTATILASPAFQPIPETKTLFQKTFRAHIFAGGGLRNIIAFNHNFQLRLSGYAFQPYQTILSDENKKAVFGEKFANHYYIASGALVYFTPVGPISFNVNYYDGFDKPWHFMFHFGYILFNKKGLE